MTSNSTWGVCQVPTNAIVTYVTTRKNGNSYTNGGSVKGGTLVWIYGKSKLKI
jgi:hypothetical protein